MGLLQKIETNKYLFHGSHNCIKIGDFLLPHKSFHGENYLYATTDFLYALVRCGNFKVTEFLIRENYNGEYYELAELQKDAFKRVFNTDGWIYIVRNENFYTDERMMSNEFYSSSPSRIIGRIHILNIWEEIKKYPDFFHIYYENDKEYWKTVSGGKEGYLQRREKAIQKIKGAK